MKNLIKNKKIAVLALMVASTTFSTLASATVTSGINTGITTSTVASVKDENKGVVDSRWSVCFAGWCYSFV